MEVVTEPVMTDMPPLEHAPELEQASDEAPAEVIEADQKPTVVIPPKKKVGMRTGLPAEPRDESTTSVRRDLSKDENIALRDLIQSYGKAGDFQVYLARTSPETARDINGRVVACVGHIKKWDSPTTPIDEEYIKQNWGGGTFQIKFKQRDNRGSWVWAGSRTVTIAGEPLVESSAPAQAIAPVPGAETPGVVSQALGMMQDMTKSAIASAEKRGGSNANDPLVQVLRDTIASQERMLAEMRAEIRAISTKEPVKEDTYKDVLLKTMLEGDSQRVSQIREAHAAELRQAKESAIENERRLQDRAERDRQELRNAHEREIALLRSSHESQLATVKSSYEVQLGAIKSSVDTSNRLADAENRRLEASNGELRGEIKELRAKKDKTLMDSFEEVKKMKQLLGDDEGDAEPEGFMGKLMSAVNPETIGALGSILRPPQAPAPQAIVTPAQAQAQLQPKRRVVLDKETGKKMIQEANGTLTEIAERPTGAPAGPVWPQVDPEIIRGAVSMLESAFQNSSEPAIVAQGIRSRVPEELVAAIRDHGIDQMMAQMAKLPGSSPLSSQAGRLWLRKFSKELVGE